MISTHTLYPDYAVKNIRSLWGVGWRRLIDWVAHLSPIREEALAFSLMMRRMQALRGAEVGGLCNDPGCAMCASALLENYGGSERDLLDEYYRTLDEVKGFLARQTRPARMVA